MSLDQLMAEIREVNLGFLLLAQRMLGEDREAALYRLGISQDIAQALESLTPGQIVKMAHSSTLLCRPRFDSRMLMDVVSGQFPERQAALAGAHAAILAANQPRATTETSY